VQDYYAFGMQMPGRKLSGGYRYGFNGKENDNEVKGEGNQQDYGMRIYDGRIGKFLSTDPLAKKYPELSAYQFASNSPIENSDLDGAEAISEIKSGLARKMEMRVFSVSMKDAETQVRENQIRALLYYYATNPNAHAKQSISEAPKEVSDRVRQLRREHFQDPETGEKTAAGRFFENTHYEKFNDNIVTPMAEAAIGEGAGKFLFRGGSLISRNATQGVTQVEQYALRAAEDGFYPVMKRGFANPQELTWLNKGDVWKFGTTKNPLTRYSQSFLDNTGAGLRYSTEFSGTLKQATTLERMKILNFRGQNGFLPAGNKIIK
jgi:RHS repeat-associated protein